MAAVTIYRLAEQAIKLIEGGTRAAGSSLTFNEVKIACGQVINSLLKTDYLTVNSAMKETIPNGTTLGLYEGIDVFSYNGKSRATLPIKPLKLPRNMGIWAIYPGYVDCSNTDTPSSKGGISKASINEISIFVPPSKDQTGIGIEVGTKYQEFTCPVTYELDKEFIPLQMGQGALIKSQPLINDLMGQVGYENFGMDVIFTKDLKTLFPNIKLAMRLAIMDISMYGDYDPLPILPEQEWQVIQEVYKIYATQVVPDKLVDPTVEESKNIPTSQQKSS